MQSRFLHVLLLKVAPFCYCNQRISWGVYLGCNVKRVRKWWNVSAESFIMRVCRFYLYLSIFQELILSLIGYSRSYYTGIKPVFLETFGFFPCEMKKIILHEMRFNPHEARLNWAWENLDNLNVVKISEFSDIQFNLTWCGLSLILHGFNLTSLTFINYHLV